MPEDHHLAGRLRLGVFEMDLRAGELRKHGLKVRLQEQPFQVLAMLVEHGGEVVTREELQKKLWPAETFVDFDHGLNKAINKIREALSDSSASPRFVETVARRGYRFLADVKDVDGALKGPGSVNDNASMAINPDVKEVVHLSKSLQLTLGWKIAGFAFLLLIAGFAGWRLRSRSHPQSGTFLSNPIRSS
jgi:DNA-binding winged helix-turn-helix (wHTH) protein